MNYEIPVFILSFSLWIFLAYRFVHAFKNHKLTNRASLYAWGIFFLCYSIVALNVPSVETEINVLFDDLPVAAFVRNVAILATAHLYFLATRHIDGPSLQRKQLFLRLNPLIMVLCIVLFGFMASRAVSFEVMTHVIKDIRDGSMLVWTILIFIPASLQMWRLEDLRPMKLRYAFNSLFYSAFILECATGLVWSFTVFVAPGLQDQALILDRFSIFLCLGLFFVMLFPFRWLMPLFYPKQLQLYLRLRRLEAAVKQSLAGAKRSLRTKQMDLWRTPRPWRFPVGIERQ